MATGIDPALTQMSAAVSVSCAYTFEYNFTQNAILCEVGGVYYFKV